MQRGTFRRTEGDQNGAPGWTGRVEQSLRGPELYGVLKRVGEVTWLLRLSRQWTDSRFRRNHTVGNAIENSGGCRTRHILSGSADLKDSGSQGGHEALTTS